MVPMVNGERGYSTMEREFDLRLKIQRNSSNGIAQKAKSFPFRAPQENFSIQDFELGKIFGVGSYSKVVRAVKKDSGVVYALKVMDKEFITKENKTAYVKLERTVLDQLDHPGIVKLFFTFQDTFSLYMALENCEGGELFDQITRKGRLSEDEARFYAAEVVEALEYIHGMGLIHRDIKPENLLLTADGHIKIADFGSVKPMQDSRITVLPNAASDDIRLAPLWEQLPISFQKFLTLLLQLLVRNDLWALGCILYQMLSGTSPFKDASEWLIFQRIIARYLRFPNYFSEEAKHLIDQLLDKNPSRRPGAGRDGYASLKIHPFFRGVDWGNLRSSTPPNLVRESGLAGSNDCYDPSSSEGHGHITRIASIDSFDSKWQQFLETGESVLMISMVKKLRKLSNRKVQLILTNMPKLVYVEPSKLSEKRNIFWSDNPNELSVQVISPTNFKICTSKKVTSFEDANKEHGSGKRPLRRFRTDDLRFSFPRRNSSKEAG